MGFSKMTTGITLDVGLAGVFAHIAKQLGVQLLLLALLLLGESGPGAPSGPFRTWLHLSQLINLINYIIESALYQPPLPAESQRLPGCRCFN